MCLVSLVQGPSAADWPSYRHDGNRSAVSAEAVSGKLNPQWVFESRHRPRTAWPMPGEETPRMHSDRAYNVVVSGRTLFFGNNVEITCTRWTPGRRKSGGVLPPVER